MPPAKPNILEPAEQYLLSVLFADNARRPLPAPAEEVFREAHYLAQRQRVEPWFLSRVLESAGSIHVPEVIVSKAQKRWLELQQDALQYADQSEKISASLGARGITHAFFKGCSSGALLYGNIFKRMPGDIDLLVPRSAFTAALDCLGDLGFGRLTELRYGELPLVPAPDSTSVTLSNSANSLCVDLHSGVLEDRFQPQIPGELLLERSRPVLLSPSAISLPAFTIEDTLLIGSLHGLKHMWCRLIWILDFVQAGSGNCRIDWDLLLVEAERHKAQRPLCLAFQVASLFSECPLPTPISSILRDAPSLGSSAQRIARQVFASRSGWREGIANLLFQMKVLGRLSQQIPLSIGRGKSLLRRLAFRSLSGYTGAAVLKGRVSFVPNRYFQPVITGLKNPGIVPLAGMPGHLVAAVLLHEDNLFLRHHGFHWREMRRRIRDYLRGGKAASGSSISQQLVKFVFLRKHKSIMRKLHEALLTIQLEKTFSKEEILTLYLNTVRLGPPPIYGVQNAAMYYFEKGVSDLSLDESFFLAALIPAPMTRAKKYLSQEGELHFDYHTAFLRYFELFRLYCKAFGPLAIEAPEQVSAAGVMAILREAPGIDYFKLTGDQQIALELRAIRQLGNLSALMKGVRKRRQQGGYLYG